MSASMIEQLVQHEAETVRELLPVPDFTRPGPSPASIAEIADELASEYSDALRLLGRL